jgi:hypothetical protein
VAWASTADGAILQIVGCSGNPAQQWVLSAAGDLMNPQSNKCADIDAWNPNDGAKLVLWECPGGANQTARSSAGRTWDAGNLPDGGCRHLASAARSRSVTPNGGEPAGGIGGGCGAGAHECRGDDRGQGERAELVGDGHGSPASFWLGR